jgi:hypothetical protein
MSGESVESLSITGNKISSSDGNYDAEIFQHTWLVEKQVINMLVF